MRLLEGEPPPEIVALRGPGCDSRRVGNTAADSSDGDGVTVTGATTPVEPTAAAEPPEQPSVLDRARSALSRTTSRRIVGWALVVGWVVWLVAVWFTQPRLVPQDVLADELAQGRATAYRVVTVDLDKDRGPLSGPYRVDVYPASDDEDGAVDGLADGRPLTVAYWVDSPVGSLRVLDPVALSFDTPTAVVGRFTAAGVPEAGAADLWFRTAARRTSNAGALLLLVSTLVVILGPRPRRGTRWFWFWVVGGPLSVGVPIFAVAELLRPRYEPEGTVRPPGVAGRWSGLVGFALGVVLSIAGAAALSALTSVSPIWFVNG